MYHKFGQTLKHRLKRDIATGGECELHKIIPMNFWLCLSIKKTISLKHSCKKALINGRGAGCVCFAFTLF